MIIRMAQRNRDDCAICALAMVMGHPYTYERVLVDSQQAKYPKSNGVGKFLAWWELYLRDEGFYSEYRSFNDLYSLTRFGGGVLGLVTMDVPRLGASHIVAVDELGVVDPADNAPDHVVIGDYVRNRRLDGVRFHDEWLAIKR